MRSLPRMVADAKVGSSPEMVLWRKGQEKRVRVKLGEMPEDEADAVHEPDAADEGDATSGSQKLLGLMLKPLSPTLKRQFGIPDTVNGLLITGIDEESDAAEKGLRPGDVVLEANQLALKDMATLKTVIQAAKRAGRDFVLLRVVRGAETVFVTLPVR